MGTQVNYSDGDGKDVIYDYQNGRDIIYVTKGNITKISTNKNDVILTVGKGTITVKEAKGTGITVADTSGNISTKRYGDGGTVLQDGVRTEGGEYIRI